MKKLLILGAGLLQIPIIEKAKELEIYTIVMDGDPNAEGLVLADLSIVIDICNPDLVLEKLKELEKDELFIDGVIHPCSEVAMNTLGSVTEKYELPGLVIDDIPKVTNKALMRQSFSENKAPSPKSYVSEKYSEFVEFIKLIDGDAIVKPSRNSGSRGITRLEVNSNEAQLKEAFDVAFMESRDASVVIEEYIEGPEFSVEIIIFEGVIRVLAVTDKITTGTPHFVELGHSQPSSFSSEQVAQVRKAAIQGCKALGINNCAVHAEIKLQNNKAYIIEIGARLGGDFISTKLVSLSTGVDMVGAAIMIALGNKPNLAPKHNEQGACIRYFTPRAGKLLSLNYNLMPFEQYIEDFKIYCKIGDQISSVHSSLNRSGHVIVTSSTIKRAIQIADKIIDEIAYQVE